MFSRPPHPSSVSGFQSGRGPDKGLREDKAKDSCLERGQLLRHSPIPDTQEPGDPLQGKLRFHFMSLCWCFAAPSK